MAVNDVENATTAYVFDQRGRLVQSFADRQIPRGVTELRSQMLEADDCTYANLELANTTVLEGYSLGQSGLIVCRYTGGDVRERMRFSLLQWGLNQATDGKVRLVTYPAFPRDAVLDGEVVLSRESEHLRDPERLGQELIQVLRDHGVTSRAMLRYRLVLNELAANTVHHAQGGRLWLSVEDGDLLNIYIEDDGPGIPHHRIPGYLFHRGAGSSGQLLGFGWPVIMDQSHSVTVGSSEHGTRCLVRLEL